MTVLVTGGLGFIGHNVVEKLQSQGCDVVVLDNLNRYGESIPEHEHRYLINERKSKFKQETEIYKRDAETGLFLDVANIEYIIHLAEYPRQAVVKKLGFGNAIKSSVNSLINICKMPAYYNIKKIVYASSSMVYGNFSDDITEDALCLPINEYGRMKQISEFILKTLAEEGKFNYTILRPSAVYGPNDVSDRVVAKYLVNAMRGNPLVVNGANEKLDFTHVDDVAEGIVKATLSDTTINNTYNLTRSHSRTLLEAAELAINIAGKGKIEIREKNLDFPSRGMLNIERARKDFDFAPTIDIEQGFVQYYKYLQNSSFWSS